MERIGPYEVVRELGRGGMGAVHEVRDHTERRLALKLILPHEVSADALARFGREAELLARVRHPNVVTVHSLGRTDDGQPYLVTDFVEGRPLTVVAPELDPRAAARLVRALCDGVSAVHAQGVIHRDLKPDNVIVRPDGSPVLLDFGVARDLRAQSLTQTGQMVGTPHYMAPEQAEGKGLAPIDERSDVYGLGAVLFTLLAGRRPFHQESGLPLVRALLLDEPRWPRADRPEVPRRLEAILRRAMAKRPAERHPSASALGADLAAFLSGRRASRRGLLPLALASVVGLAALVVAHARRAPPPAGVPVAPPPAPAPSPTDVAPLVTSQTARRTAAPPRRQPGQILELGPVTAVAFAGQTLAVAWPGELILVRGGPGGTRELTRLALEDDWGPPLLYPTAHGAILCAGRHALFPVTPSTRALPAPTIRITDGNVITAVAGSNRWVVLGVESLDHLVVAPSTDREEHLQVAQLPLPGRVRDLAFSPDGRRLACATTGRERHPEGDALRLFDEEFLELAVVRAPGGFVCVAFASDDLLAAADARGRLLLLDRAGTSSELAPVGAHAGPVLDLAATGDGRTLYSLARSQDGLERELVVWDLAARAEVGRTALARGACALAADVGAALQVGVGFDDGGGAGHLELHDPEGLREAR